MKKLLAPILRRIARSLGVEELQRRLDGVEIQLGSRSVSDALYADIEERFRGDSETIKNRQRFYVPHIEASLSGLPVLDLGSGRAEWMEILHERGIDAVGIDSNQQFVESARSRGLNVSHGDLLQHLATRPDSSAGAVTMFQVAEHLPLGVLESVITHAHRVLCQGGTLVVEIPNIETLRVGAATFWIDPTHERPLFPEFLVFMVQRAGFTDVQRVTSTPLSTPPTGLSGTELEMFTRINGDGDFAVIARK